MFPMRGRPFMLCSGSKKSAFGSGICKASAKALFLQFYYKFFTDAADTVNRMLQLYAKLI